MVEIISGLWVPKISKFRPLEVHRILPCVLLNQTIEAYFGPSPEVHRFMPCLFWIKGIRFTLDDPTLEIYPG
jgi:hypothetical protein